MKLRLLVVALLLGGAVAVMSPAAAVQRSLVMSGTAFHAGSCTLNSGTGDLSIHVDDTVVWTNCDLVQHSVTWNNGTFTEQVVDPNGTAQATFASAGTFPYHCKFHASMTGTINVSQPATTTTAKPTTTTAKPTTTTVKPTTTTASPATTTTPTTIDLTGAFGDESTTSSSSSSSMTGTTEASKSDGGGSSAAVVGLLLLAIAGVGGAAYYAFRRLRETS